MDLKPYLAVLSKAKPVWMDGRELGMAVKVGLENEPYPIQLWPYAHGRRVSSLANTLTEEVAHYVHSPTLDGDDKGTPQNVVMRALAKRLMREPRWQAAVYKWLSTHYHWSLKDLFKKKKVTIG
jgi:hypothetical protein